MGKEKKKPRKKTKAKATITVTPKIKKETKYVRATSLSNDFCLYDGELAYIPKDYLDAYNINGIIFPCGNEFELKDAFVIPVNVIIKWEKRN